MLNQSNSNTQTPLNTYTVRMKKTLPPNRRPVERKNQLIALKSSFSLNWKSFRSPQLFCVAFTKYHRMSTIQPTYFFWLNMHALHVHFEDIIASNRKNLLWSRATFSSIPIQSRKRHWNFKKKKKKWCNSQWHLSTLKMHAIDVVKTIICAPSLLIHFSSIPFN